MLIMNGTFLGATASGLRLVDQAEKVFRVLVEILSFHDITCSSGRFRECRVPFELVGGLGALASAAVVAWPGPFRSGG
jgi:hypothetical protein